MFLCLPEKNITFGMLPKVLPLTSSSSSLQGIKCQSFSALVSFVGSEILKQAWYFAHLIVLWHAAEGTTARKSSSKLGISLT